MKDYLDFIIGGNSIYQYILALAGILLAWIVLKLIKNKVLGYLKKVTSRTVNNFDDMLVEVAKRFVIPYLYLFINYTIITRLYLSPEMKRILLVAIMVVTLYYLVRLVNNIIHRSVVLYMEQKEELPERIKQVSGMLIVVKIATWGFGLVMLIDNLGFDVTTIIAGLGVGGIAIALAAQNILGDLFSYFVIFFDKPFEIGDMIKVDNNSGVVEKIGIKTSHLRSPDGQQLVMPNAELVKSVIHNFKRLERRRVLFSIGVVYNTTHAKLKNIPDMIKGVIQQDLATFDRVHLKSFGDFSINYEIVYYVETQDYLTYMNTHHQVCLNIFEQFEKEGIEFAFPTQTIFLNQQNGEGEKNGNHSGPTDELVENG